MSLGWAEPSAIRDKGKHTVAIAAGKQLQAKKFSGYLPDGWGSLMYVCRCMSPSLQCECVCFATQPGSLFETSLFPTYRDSGADNIGERDGRPIQQTAESKLKTSTDDRMRIVRPTRQSQSRIGANKGPAAVNAC